MRIARLPVWKIIVPFLLLVSVVIILSSFYVFNTNNYKGKSKLIEFNKIKPIILPNDTGIDIDNQEDWNTLEKKFNELR